MFYPTLNKIKSLFFSITSTYKNSLGYLHNKNNICCKRINSPCTFILKLFCFNGARYSIYTCCGQSSAVVGVVRGLLGSGRLECLGCNFLN